MATSYADGHVTYLSDCLEVVDTIAKGTCWATAAERPMARAWTMLAATLSTGPPFGDIDIAWMPSHTSQHVVGEVHLSLLSKRDRDGDNQADRLAKLGAALNRVPPKVIAQVPLRNR